MCDAGHHCQLGLAVARASAGSISSVLARASNVHFSRTCQAEQSCTYDRQVPRALHGLSSSFSSDPCCAQVLEQSAAAAQRDVARGWQQPV